MRGSARCRHDRTALFVDIETAPIAATVEAFPETRFRMALRGHRYGDLARRKRQTS